MTTDKASGVGLQRFSAAVQQRFADGAVRHATRSWPDRRRGVGAAPAHQAALAPSAGPSTRSRKASVPAPAEVEAVWFARPRALGHRRGLKL